MKELFIPYSQAVKLKEMGFLEPCFAYYGEINGGEIELFKKKHFDIEALYVLAPLWQQAWTFLLDKIDNLRRGHQIKNGEYTSITLLSDGSGHITTDEGVEISFYEKSTGINKLIGIIEQNEV